MSLNDLLFKEPELKMKQKESFVLYLPAKVLLIFNLFKKKYVEEQLLKPYTGSNSSRQSSCLDVGCSALSSQSVEHHCSRGKKKK